MNLKLLIPTGIAIIVVFLAFRTCSVEGEPSLTPDLVAALQASGIDSIPTQFIDIEDIGTDPYVIGDHGTLVYLQKDALLDSSGNPVNTNIQLELKEVQTIEDFTKGRISTQSNGQLLSTAGTYFLNATSDGQQLQIDPEIGLNVSFPTVSKDPDMQLFKGEPTASGDVNWISTEEKETPIPRPTIEEPKDLTDYSGQYQLREAKAFLDDIDANFEKVGDQYVHASLPNNYMKWQADYVDKVRTWYQHNQYKMALYAKQQEAFRKAYERYVSRPEVKAWLDYAQKQKSALEQQRTAFEYSLKEFGWYNCDKFREEALVEYSGELTDESGDRVDFARVHLISREENIHITQVIEDGTFAFRYPQNLPFEIYATTVQQEVKQKFDGTNKELGSLVLKAPKAEVQAASAP